MLFLKTKVSHLLDLILILLIVASCKKDEQPIIPNIQTISANVRNDSIYLKANITDLGKSSVEAYGFVISTKLKPATIITKLVQKKPVILGEFSIVISDNFVKDSSYSVKSFIQVTEGVYYGDSLTFVSKNLYMPRIDNFTPTFGYDGEYVKIYGSNFGAAPENIKVLFGNIEAELISATTTRLLVKVPTYISPDNCQITIKVKEKQVTSIKTFFLYGPIITDFTPGEGKGNVTITLNGSGFSTTTWRNIVKIGDYQADVIEATENKIVVTASLNSVMPSIYSISITVKEKTFITSQKYKVLSPWKQLSYLPDGVASSVCFRIKNKIYLTTGTDMWGCTCWSKMFMEYNIENDTWTKKSDFPGEVRNDAAGFSIGNKGYVGLGTFLEWGALSDFWEYDQAQDSWTRKSDFPGGARERSMSFEFNGKGYILMGHNLYPNLPANGLVDFWSYDPLANKWQRLPDFPNGNRAGSFVALLNEKLYLIGGSGSKSVWKFDLTSNQWKYVNELEFIPVNVMYGNNRCFFIKLSSKKLYEYMPETNSLVKMSDFPGLVRDVENASVGLFYNNKIYFGAGVNYGPVYGELLRDFWSCDID
jgi:N-acetylneuraminic acid mutarotase